jgi:hypothetical protein
MHKRCTMHKGLLAALLLAAGATFAAPYQYSFSAPQITTGPPQEQTTNAFSFAFTSPTLLIGSSPINLVTLGTLNFGSPGYFNSAYPTLASATFWPDSLPSNPVGDLSINFSNGSNTLIGSIVGSQAFESVGIYFVNWQIISSVAGGNVTGALTITDLGDTPAAFFTDEVNVGSGVDYLQFPDNLFGYYSFVASSIFYHYDMGFEAFIPGLGADIYFYDFTSSHWFYTSNTLFPYLYDFTLKTWIYYLPDRKNPGHYTTNPRYFSNLTTGLIFTM